jgi:hypothetical protein
MTGSSKKPNFRKALASEKMNAAGGIGLVGGQKISDWNLVPKV